jgi:Rieske Fe-S protein
MSNSDEGCCGCSRRAALQGIVAATALVPLAAGCRLEDADEGGNAGGVDAPPGTGDAPDPGFAMCGANICVDLNSSQNSMLATPGGFRVIAVPGDKIIISRIDATTFDTHTAVCTHAGCSVKYVAAASQFQCPCHGSKYDLDGNVVVGPATRALKSYDNTFDEPGALLTIML